jgi:hypothetical protein
VKKNNNKKLNNLNKKRKWLQLKKLKKARKPEITSKEYIIKTLEIQEKLIWIHLNKKLSWNVFRILIIRRSTRKIWKKWRFIQSRRRFSLICILRILNLFSKLKASIKNTLQLPQLPKCLKLVKASMLEHKLIEKCLILKPPASTKASNTLTKSKA